MFRHTNFYCLIVISECKLKYFPQDAIKIKIEIMNLIRPSTCTVFKYRHVKKQHVSPDWTGEDCHAYFEILNQGCRDQCYPFTGLKVVNERIYIYSPHAIKSAIIITNILPLKRQAKLNYNLHYKYECPFFMCVIHHCALPCNGLSRLYLS